MDDNCVAQHHEREEFGEFGRLQQKRADGQPACGAADFPPEKKRQDEEHDACAVADQDKHPPCEASWIHGGHGEARDGADGQPDELPPPVRPHGIFIRDVAGAVDEKHAVCAKRADNPPENRPAESARHGLQIFSAGIFHSEGRWLEKALIGGPRGGVV